LQPRYRSFVQHDSAVVLRTQRLPTPCAHRLGERTKRRRLGRVTVTPRADSIASWAVEPVSRSLDPTSFMGGFSAHESSGPHAPSTNSTFRLDDGRTCYRRSITEGPAPAFRPLPARSTLLRRTMTTCPVPGDWPSPSLDSVPRSASRPALDHGVKMPRTRFYNRRFAPRAPMTNITSGDCPSSTVGNPPAFDFEIACWIARALGARVSSGDAGPPCGHPNLQRPRV
jgi:hypothetical protein